MLARSGEITEPWPVPLSLTVTTPSSRIPALSHLRIRRMMRSIADPMLQETDQPILADRCRRKRRHTTHLRDHPDYVTIIRERHAFEGQTLAVISSIKRRGVLLVLVILPNGSRSLIPASWTDWRDPHDTETSSSADDVIHAPALGKFGDLLQLRKVIDALQRRHIESASHVESSNAAEPLSRPFRSAVKPHVVEPAAGRLGSTRREARGSLRSNCWRASSRA